MPEVYIQPTRISISLFVVFAFTSLSNAATFLVNSTEDRVVSPSKLSVYQCDTGKVVTVNGKNVPQCTLRAALQIANKKAGADSIVLPAGTYTLTIQSKGDNPQLNETDGDLNINDDLTIQGASKKSTIIDGASLGNRIFHISAPSRGSQRTVAISDVTIQNGSVTQQPNGQFAYGGGVLIDNGASVALSHCIITQNRVYNFGGGIANLGNLSIFESEISNNKVTTVNAFGGGTGLGGGILSSGSLLIYGSTISGNTAPNGGGILTDLNGTAQIQNSTISGNTAAVIGGGIENSSPRLEISYSTITANQSSSAGTSSSEIVKAGGIANIGGSVYLTGTILAGNTLSNSGASPNCLSDRSLASFGGNVINASSTTCPIVSFLPGDQIISGLNPKLAPLADNGGPTRTHALLTGSPAIDINSFGLVTCFPADQRGYHRPTGGNCDAGAYEFGAPAPPPAQAIRTMLDTKTQGNWRNFFAPDVYGRDGYIIPNYATKLPSYASWSISGNVPTTSVWSDFTFDQRALERDIASTRIAPYFYSPNSFTIELSLTGGPHQVALYFLDWDTKERVESVSILDFSSRKELDKRTISNFNKGVYEVWNIQGHVLIQIQKIAGLNAVVSGLFFSTFSSPIPQPLMSILTSGNLFGTIPLNASAFSSQGIASVQFQLNGANLGPPLTGPDYTYQWPTKSVANGVYTLTALALDNEGQTSVSPDATVSVQNVLPPTSAAFVRLDATTRGTWKGRYGADGEIIADDSKTDSSYAAVDFTDATPFSWTLTGDSRALQQASSLTSRIASTFYSPSKLTIDLNLFDGQTHQMALYFLDWDHWDRVQSVTIYDADTMSVLDTRSIANFEDGKYLVWNVSGHVLIDVEHSTAPNAVVSGLFLSPVP